MKNYILAYISLLIINIILFIFIIRILGYIEFGYIDAKNLLFLLVFPLSLIYHKYKPMPFKNVITKFVGIKLPDWKTIKYKFMLFLGVDKETLDKDKRL